jgi:hypothetical protein
MINRIKELKIKSRTASEKEIETIDLEMEKLSIENPHDFANAMLECIEESNKIAEELILKKKLEAVLPIISVSYLAKNYFKKTPQWFYQRLNGNSVNGKQAHFTHNELETLSVALKEIGQKLSTSATHIF